ncbi:hypothetical protein [Streptomyces sp. NPDC015125]|uniref:hypothetical protein n=1 Tax=Streptomyces sp. NPDC015125 TaxID=3364938 RepID=UPI0036F59502
MSSANQDVKKTRSRPPAAANAFRWAEVAEKHARLQKEASEFAQTARAEEGNWLPAAGDADFQGKKKDDAIQMALMWATIAQVQTGTHEDTP